MTADAPSRLSAPPHPRMRNLFQRPLGRFIAAHIIACYAWVGAIALYDVLSPSARQTPTIEPGFHDADGSGFDDVDEHDDPWYLRRSIIAAAAPLSVPCVLLATVFFT